MGSGQGVSASPSAALTPLKSEIKFLLPGLLSLVTVWLQIYQGNTPHLPSLLSQSLQGPIYNLSLMSLTLQTVAP